MFLGKIKSFMFYNTGRFTENTHPAVFLYFIWSTAANLCCIAVCDQVASCMTHIIKEPDFVDLVIISFSR